MLSHWSRRSAVIPLALAFLVVLAASAQACLTLPASSTWEGRSTDQFNYQATWRATVTTTETSPGVWTTEGNGKIIIPFYGETDGRVEGTLTCTGPTTDSVAGSWKDNFGDNVTTVGSLTIGSSVAVESGTWQGATRASQSDQGGWEGEFHPTDQSGGSIPGNVEVESSAGTLITSMTVGVATELPLLPSNEDVAPVGDVSFAANLPVGATVKVKLILPPGSHPTSLLKLEHGGTYVEVPATISGETIEYEITDGGALDEDGVANGEVVDPVVPVSKGLQVRTGELGQATPGTPYALTLTASGGSGAYKWKKVGKLPKGLKLNKAGVIEGTPSAKLEAGSYPVEVGVSDSAKPKHKALAHFMLTVT